MKYLLDGSNNNLDTTEENTIHLENKSIENTNQSTITLRTKSIVCQWQVHRVKLSNTYVTVISGEGKGNGELKILEDMLAEIFPKLIKNSITQI